MLPRLRFVVASLLIAVLPMVFLGAGLAPTAHTSPAELSRADKPIVLGPAEYSEAQYRQDRLALSYARRETELSKLRTLASAPLSEWIAAPAGAEPDNAGPVATITTSGPAVIAVNTTNPASEKTAEVTVSVAVSPADKRPAEVTVQVATPENDKSAAPATDSDKPAVSKPDTAAAAPPSANDAPRTTAAPAPSAQVFAALNPAKTETSTLPQVHVVMSRPKPRAHVVRRPKPAPPPPPVVQQTPPFFELFAWLFNLKPQPAPVQPQQTVTVHRAQPQARSSITPAAPFRTAAQP